jgi:hypothetical protein
MRRFISLIAGADTVPFLEAYFDESGTHDNSPIMCIAGYLFDKENCQALDLAWKTVLDEYELPYFHMVDCAHHSFPFDRLTKDECDKVARKMIALIRILFSAWA